MLTSDIKNWKKAFDRTVSATGQFSTFPVIVFYIGVALLCNDDDVLPEKRTFSLRRLLDIGIDSCGALLGSLILLFFVYRADQRHQKLEKGV